MYSKAPCVSLFTVCFIQTQVHELCTAVSLNMLKAQHTLYSSMSSTGRLHPGVDSKVRIRVAIPLSGRIKFKNRDGWFHPQNGLQWLILDWVQLTMESLRWHHVNKFSLVSVCGSEKNRGSLDVSNSVLCSSSGEREWTPVLLRTTHTHREICLHGVTANFT